MFHLSKGDCAVSILRIFTYLDVKLRTKLRGRSFFTPIFSRCSRIPYVEDNQSQLSSDRVRRTRNSFVKFYRKVLGAERGELQFVQLVNRLLNIVDLCVSSRAINSCSEVQRGTISGQLSLNTILFSPPRCQTHLPCDVPRRCKNPKSGDQTSNEGLPSRDRVDVQRPPSINPNYDRKDQHDPYGARHPSISIEIHRVYLPDSSTVVERFSS